MVNIAEIKRQMLKERLEKAFGSEEIEKARHGVYADNAENRAKQRVGQEYGQAAQPQEPGEKRQPKGSEEGGGDIKSYASNASDEALKRAAADKNAKPEVRAAAKNELANRNGGKKKENESAPKSSSGGSNSSLSRNFIPQTMDAKVYQDAFEDAFSDIDDEYSITSDWGDIDRTFAELGSDETINISDIVSPQDHIDLNKVKKYMKQKVFNGAYGVKFEGDSEVYLADGNHRVGAAMKSGKSTVKMKIITLPK